MGWNHRIMKRGPYPMDGYVYGIHEVYYDEYDNPMMWTQEPVAVTGCNMKDLHVGYEIMKRAFGKPVLDYDTGLDADYYYMWS